MNMYCKPTLRPKINQIKCAFPVCLVGDFIIYSSCQINCSYLDFLTKLISGLADIMIYKLDFSRNEITAETLVDTKYCSKR